MCQYIVCEIIFLLVLGQPQNTTGDTLEKVKGKKIKVIIFVDQTVVVFSESHNTPPKASA